MTFDPHRKRRARTNVLDEARAANRPLTPAEYKTLTAPKGASETRQQQDLASRVRTVLAAGGPLAEVFDTLTAVPHAEQSKAQAGKKWAEGVRAGYPDLLLDDARGGYYGLRIEMKRLEDFTYAKGQPSGKQQEWHRRLWQKGYCVVTCWGPEAAWNALLWYAALVPTSSRPWYAVRSAPVPAFDHTRCYTPEVPSRE